MGVIKRILKCGGQETESHRSRAALANLEKIPNYRDMSEKEDKLDWILISEKKKIDLEASQGLGFGQVRGRKDL